MILKGSLKIFNPRYYKTRYARAVVVEERPCMDTAPTATQTRSVLPNCFVGIDPGKMGGIAVISDTECILALKMPPTEEETLENLEYILEEVNVLSCFLEEVHPMPSFLKGSISNFKLGQSYGQLRAFLVACGVKFETVNCRRWQNYLNCPSGGDKNVLKRAAEVLFPKVIVNLYVADALLIAEYARRTYYENGKNNLNA